MDLLVLIIFGAIVGWIASMLMGSGGGVLWDVIMGIIGAAIGGWIFNQFGQPGVTGFNLYSFLVAIIGACIVIFIGRMFRRAA